MKNKIIIDGNNIANRMFFAFKRLSVEINGQTIGTGAIYGFTKFVVDLAVRYQTSNVVVVWDSGSSYRRELYPEYKAGRDYSHYPDMMSQIHDLSIILSAMNIDQIRADGYEADDVIYTLVNKPIDGLTVLASSDKDFLLFIRDNVILFQPGKDGIVDMTNIHKVYGVTSGQLLDFFALRGDTSDNIKGVPGIGTKTAQRIIHECGCIENALQVSEVNGVQKSKLKSLRENIDQFELAKKLISPLLIDDNKLLIDEGIIDEVIVIDILNKYRIKTIRISEYFQLLGVNNADTKEKSDREI